jgi:hypothetical protein
MPGARCTSSVRVITHLERLSENFCSTLKKFGNGAGQISSSASTFSPYGPENTVQSHVQLRDIRVSLPRNAPISRDQARVGI